MTHSTINVYDRIEALPCPPPSDGIFVIIDVLRFSTTASVLSACSIQKLIPVIRPEQAFELQQQYPEAILVGEQNSTPIDGFDYTNSPVQIRNAQPEADVAVVRTSNGTRAMKQISPHPFVLAAPVCHRRVITVLEGTSIPIHIVACGSHGEVAREDLTYARHLKLSLNNSDPEPPRETVRKRIKNSPHARELQTLNRGADVQFSASFDKLHNVYRENFPGSKQESETENLT